jgi:hypothetical protein
VPDTCQIHIEGERLGERLSAPVTVCLRGVNHSLPTMTARLLGDDPAPVVTASGGEMHLLAESLLSKQSETTILPANMGDALIKQCSDASPLSSALCRHPRLKGFYPSGIPPSQPTYNPREFRRHTPAKL